MTPEKEGPFATGEPHAPLNSVYGLVEELKKNFNAEHRKPAAETAPPKSETEEEFYARMKEAHPADIVDEFRRQWTERGKSFFPNRIEEAIKRLHLRREGASTHLQWKGKPISNQHTNQ